jgi:hypothetical protein
MVIARHSVGTRSTHWHECRRVSTYGDSYSERKSRSLDAERLARVREGCECVVKSTPRRRSSRVQRPGTKYELCERKGFTKDDCSIVRKRMQMIIGFRRTHYANENVLYMGRRPSRVNLMHE